MLRKALAIAIIGFLWVISEGEAAHYRYKTLDDPSAVFGTEAYGINRSGQIVGYWIDGSGKKNGFLLDGGVFTNFVCGSNTVPQAINDLGQIVGYCQAVDVQGFSTADTVNFEFFGTPGVDNVYLSGINNENEMVGFFDSPYVQGTNGMIVGGNDRLNYPGGTSTFPRGVNNQGEIVGNWISNGASHGFFYDNEVWSQFDDLQAAKATFPTAINDADLIVGSYIDKSGFVHGLVYNLPRGSYTTINHPNSTNTYVNGINDAGDLVGAYVDRLGRIHGFLATCEPGPPYWDHPRCFR